MQCGSLKSVADVETNKAKGVPSLEPMSCIEHTCHR